LAEIVGFRPASDENFCCSIIVSQGQFHTGRVQRGAFHIDHFARVLCDGDRLQRLFPDRHLKGSRFSAVSDGDGLGAGRGVVSTERESGDRFGCTVVVVGRDLQPGMVECIALQVGGFVGLLGDGNMRERLGRDRHLKGGRFSAVSDGDGLGAGCGAVAAERESGDRFGCAVVVVGRDLQPGTVEYVALQIGEFVGLLGDGNMRERLGRDRHLKGGRFSAVGDGDGFGTGRGGVAAEREVSYRFGCAVVVVGRDLQPGTVEYVALQIGGFVGLLGDVYVRERLGRDRHLKGGRFSAVSDGDGLGAGRGVVSAEREVGDRFGCAVVVVGGYDHTGRVKWVPLYIGGLIRRRCQTDFCKRFGPDADNECGRLFRISDR